MSTSLSQLRILKFSLFLLFFVTNCAKNPVSGNNELHLMGTVQEIKLGKQHYLYAQQQGGGKYSVDPTLTNYITSIGHNLAALSDRPDLPYEFVVLNDATPNAWALPGGKIAINRGLVVLLKNEAELAAVLGHEITHAAARHTAKSMERALILNIGLLAAHTALSTAHQNKETDSALMLGAQIGALLIATKYSRSAELEADAHGMQYMARAGYDPYAAVSLQETFLKLSENQSSSWGKAFFASHPPSKARIAANIEHAQALNTPHPLGLGQARYEKKITALIKTKPAYEMYEEGKKAFSHKQFTKALEKANAAIKLEPKEPLFYALKGDILSEKEKIAAITAYTQAIALQDDYFYYYHQRGLVYKAIGNKKAAKKDLEKSQQLLPTKSAQHAISDLR